MWSIANLLASFTLLTAALYSIARGEWRAAGVVAVLAIALAIARITRAHTPTGIGREALRRGDEPAAAGLGRLRLAYVLLSGAAFVVWSAHFIHLSSVRGPDGRSYYSLFDDAMISMRYAWNFAHGRGLVWNVGERVEGFTNPLMVLVMTIPSLVLDKARAVLAVQWVGVGLMLATAWMTMRIAEHVFEEEDPVDRAALSAISFSAALLYYPLTYWALMGMETGLLSLLVSMAIWLAIRHRGSPRPSVALAIVLGLMFYTRPDSLPQAALVWIYRAYPRRREGWQARALELGIIGGFLAALFLARYAYYGEWLPNTYYLKLTGLPLGIRLESGWEFTSKFLEGVRGALFVAIVGLALGFRPLQLLLVLLLLSATAYQVWVGGDPWTYWRIMSPYVPLLCVTTSYGMVAIGRRLVRLVRAARRAGAQPLGGAATVIAPFALVGSLGVADKDFSKEMLFERVPYQVPINRRNVLIGLELARICTPEARTGAFTAGAAPYYSGLRAIDFLGKMDKRIARLRADPTRGWNGMKSTPGHNKYDLGYSIVKLKPDYVAWYAWGHDNVKKFVDAHYVKIDIGWVLEGSPRIHWDRVHEKRPARTRHGR